LLEFDQPMISRRLSQKILTLILLPTVALSIFVTPASAAPDCPEGWTRHILHDPSKCVSPCQLGAGMSGGYYRECCCPAGSKPAPEKTNWVFGLLGQGVNFVLGKTKDNMAKWIGDVIEALIGALNILLGGTGEEEGGVGSNPLAQGGAIGMMGGMIGAVYEDYPDLRTGDFFKNTLANNILSTPAQATGVDDIQATKLDELWRVMRNISYVLMVVIMIAMGFMVMLRQQIDPRTTMTISAALPRIAVSLVLIAFSLPIAGLILDLSKVLVGLIDSVFSQFIGPGKPVPEMVGVGISNILKNFVWGRHIPVALGFGVLGTVVELFIQLIIRVIAFAAAIMIFWTLISRYASLLISVIFAPFAFLWGTLPGQEDTTSRWFRSFIVNALTFPGIYLVINIANWVVRTSIVPLPPAWEGTAADISGLVGLGILLTATKIPALLEDALQVTTPAGVARAGLEPGKILKEVPLVKRFAK